MDINYKENNGKKVFLAIPRHRYHVCRCGEHNCSANEQGNRDSNKYPSLSHFRINFNYKESGGKKSFSCQIKASISSIPMR